MKALKFFILGTTLALSAFANAQYKTTVIYFGGWGATKGQMKSWQNAANRSSYGDDYKFVGIPWLGPADKWGENDAINSRAGRAAVNKIVNSIFRAYEDDPSRAFVIAGHSSGSPLACAVMKRLAKSHPTPDYNVKFADLDGFNCDRTRFKSLCVSGLDNLQTCSKNIKAPVPRRCPWTRSKNGKSTNVCYHFSIVNSGVNGPTSMATGYGNIRPNLSWLETLDGANRYDYEHTARNDSRSRDSSDNESDASK